MGVAKYKINQDFFDVIGEKQAYYLGLLYADGNYSDAKCNTRLSLHKQDIDILYKFNNDLSHDKPIRFCGDMCELEICGKKINRRLLELGLVPRKTFKLKFPVWLDSKLWSHFIRGYFDGDGSIGFYPNAQFSIVGTEDFCIALRWILYKELDIKIRTFKIRYKDRDTNTRTIDIGGNIQVYKLMNYLYKDATVYLDRKNKKYKDFYETGN